MYKYSFIIGKGNPKLRFRKKRWFWVFKFQPFLAESFGSKKRNNALFSKLFRDFVPLTNWVLLLKKIGKLSSGPLNKQAQP